MTSTLQQIQTEPDPFGAKVLADGRTRFRIWMPQQEKVVPEGEGNPRIYLEDHKETLEMESIGGGWYELITDKAKHDSRYAVEFWNHHGDKPGWKQVPDPMSYRQDKDVHGLSVVVDPAALDWSAEPEDWKGVPQEALIIEELHVETFTPEGTLKAAIGHLDDLVKTGITAIELMPMGAVGCTHNWGYDEVLKSALHVPYGTPQDMVDFTAAAHARGLAVITDQIDNHFGPEGNYYWLHTPEFWRFDDFENIADTPLDKRKIAAGYNTPWGPAIDLSRPEIRKFFMQKNRWWQTCYRTDGVRRDAVHALRDDRHNENPAIPHFLEDLFVTAQTEAARMGRTHVVIPECEDNMPSKLESSLPASGKGEKKKRVRGNAQWADDFHHAVRALLFHENPAQGYMDKGYYQPYNNAPADVLAETLAKGFALSLDTGRNRHQTPDDLSAVFDPRLSVIFTRNHDQIGNTPGGERIEQLLEGDRLRAKKLAFERTLLMLTPAIPMLFMGQERGLATPFPFFVDFPEPLAGKVSKGRAEEFSKFKKAFLDPCAPATFESAKLPWPARSNAISRSFQSLIRQRKDHIIPHLASGVTDTKIDRFGPAGLRAEWTFGDGARLCLTLNADNNPVPLPASLGHGQNGEIVHHEHYPSSKPLPAWSIKPEFMPAPVIKPAPGPAVLQGPV